MFWVISVYFNIRNTLPKFCPSLLGHPVYWNIHIIVMLEINVAQKFLRTNNLEYVNFLNEDHGWKVSFCGWCHTEILSNHLS